MEFTVLVADDDRSIREVLKDILEMQNVKVITASDGKEAIENYEKYSPDLTLTDSMMGKHDGIYVLSKIKRINSNAKVVLITADSDIERKLDGLAPSKIVQKPFEMNEILNLVEEFRN